MKFFLEHRIPKFDFEFQLIASKDFWEWHSPEMEFNIEYAEDCSFDESKGCPVGSIEFMSRCGVATSPRNIPLPLANPKFMAGDAIYTTRKEMWNALPNENEWFVKSQLKIKDSRNGFYKATDSIPFADGDFQATARIACGFASEWRVFVYNSSIVDVQNYAGDIWALPSKDMIKQMIGVLSASRGFSLPPAYTLDVAVVANGMTRIVEMHDFYACGTYNFNDHYHMPLMLRDWYAWHKAMKGQK